MDRRMDEDDPRLHDGILSDFIDQRANGSLVGRYFAFIMSAMFRTMAASMVGVFFSSLANSSSENILMPVTSRVKNSRILHLSN